VRAGCAGVLPACTQDVRDPGVQLVCASL